MTPPSAHCPTLKVSQLADLLDLLLERLFIPCPSIAVWSVVQRFHCINLMIYYY